MISHLSRRLLLVALPLLIASQATAQSSVSQNPECKHNALRYIAASHETIGHQDCGGLSIMTPGVGVIAEFESCPSAVIFIPPYHEVLAQPGSNQTAVATGFDTSLRIYYRCEAEHILWFIPVSSTCQPFDREVTGIYHRFRLDTCKVDDPGKD